ncbi:PREDICTED: uncharacterized protein LOC106807866 [Priapulus caudatus]|uniref:Uncharacterized protein LOC106807866 n=1 Tax=Priapulus caudatus TaxID=37621 RepID=A0ABM1E0X0_PRICU|nr:PREDICTED: uncharacterized protein LOC106807866 [Priapulus caudatus]
MLRPAAMATAALVLLAMAVLPLAETVGTTQADNSFPSSSFSSVLFKESSSFPANLTDYVISTPAAAGEGASNNDAKRRQQIFEGIFYPVMAAATFIGNVINILVFTLGRMPSSALNVLLLGLSVAECTSGAAFFVFFSTNAFCDTCNRTATHVLEKVADLFFYTANWITMCLSVFRFVSVSYPLRYRTLCTRHKARIALAVSLAVNIAKEFVYWVHHFKTDEELRIVEPINQTIGRIVPCVVVLVTTLLSIVKVGAMTRESSSSGGGATSCHIGAAAASQRSSYETKVIRMLLVLLVLFFVTNAYCVMTLLCRIYDVPGNQHFLYSEAIAIGVNSSMNVVVYFWLNPCYRHAFYRVFKCPCRHAGRKGGVEHSHSANETGTAVTMDATTVMKDSSL